MDCAAVLLILLISNPCDDTAQTRPDCDRRQATIRLELGPAAGEANRQLALFGLNSRHLSAIRAAIRRTGDWSKLLSVRVATSAAAGDVPPVAGRYRIEADRIVFEPRFSFEPGIPYVVTFDPSAAGITTLAKLLRHVRIPAADLTPSTTLRAVFPSSDRLPENLLKFYLQFSAPMSQGNVYRHIRLLDADEHEVELPFLELDEELWDPSGTRLTLLLDPGRIKRGLRPREEVGPAISAGKHYTLWIESRWLDAKGAALVGDFRKTFYVKRPDDRSPNPSRWKLLAPPAGSRQPLVVRFAEPLDAALVERLLRVADARGDLVPGHSTLEDHETQWKFTPEMPWTAAEYKLLFDTVIEDLAGNSIARPFEVAIDREPRPVQARRVLEIPFEVQAPEPTGGGLP